MSFDLDAIRAQFPALAITDNGKRRIYFDNPAGTQVPLSVADAVADCLLNRNANLGGFFASSKAADAVVQGARDAMADFLNATSSEEIIFGQNMTTIALHLSRSLAHLFSEGDEIILSEMDHDANVSPWALMARDLGMQVKWLPFGKDTYEFDLDVLDQLLSERTRMVCVGGASNLTGTLNDVKAICTKARSVNALTFIDGVQSAPHVPIDVQDLGCDFFACSSYKFFGPHQGILWGRRDLLNSLEAYKVRPAPDSLPWKFETGTQSHEGLAGVLAAANYFSDVGETMAGDYHQRWSHFAGRRRNIHAAMSLLFDYEKQLADCLIKGLQAIDGITVHGLTADDAMDRRVPTVAFTHATLHPDAIAEQLGERNIFVWSGHNYAVDVVRTLGLADSGGVVRVGPVHYNSTAEIDTLLAALREIIKAV